MPTNLFKSCPSCKFKKCWTKAATCEKCGHDFGLKETVRTEKAILDDDDDVVVPEAPANKHKECPNCKTQCWHAAPFCLTCNYNFQEPTKVKPKFRESKVGASPFWKRQQLIHAPATGSYAKGNNHLLNIKPPEPETATYDDVAQWIRRLQEYGGDQSPSAEYSEQACRYLVRYGKVKTTQEGYDKLCDLIREVFANVAEGVYP